MGELNYDISIKEDFYAEYFQSTTARAYKWAQHMYCLPSEN